MSDDPRPVDDRSALREHSCLWIYVAALASVLGGVARFGSIERQSLWIDEFLWTRLGSRSFNEILFAPDGYPPLFGLIVHGLQEAGLDSDGWLRLPAAVAGTLAIPAVYWVASQLTNRRVAALAALLLSVNPLAVWYSIEVGAYAPMMLIALLSTGCLLTLLDRNERHLWWLLYGMLTWLGFGLHYYYLFVPLGQLAAVTVGRRPRLFSRALVVKVVAPATLALSLWVPLLGFDLLAQSADDAALRSVGWAALPYTGFTFLGGLSLGPPVRVLHETLRTGHDQDINRLLMNHAGVILLVGATMGALGMATLSARRDHGTIICLVVVAVILLGAWSATVVGVGYRPRYVITAVPFALIVLTDRLRSRGRIVSATLLLAVMLLQIAGVHRIHDPAHAREDSRAAARYVSRAEPSLPVLLLGEAAIPIVRYAPDTMLIRPIEDRDVRDEPSLRNLVSSELDKAGGLWLVEARPWTVDRHRFARDLPRHFRLDDQMTFAGVTVLRYSRFD